VLYGALKFFSLRKKNGCDQMSCAVMTSGTMQNEANTLSIENTGDTINQGILE
jgi:hypothetical protein